MPDLIIADDNTELAHALRRKAESCGWTVTLCRDGGELLNIYQRTSPPALLLIDVNMPGIDGIEAIQGMSEGAMSSGYRIRIMTGGSVANAVAARMIANARELNVGELIFKPFTMEEFARELETEKKLLRESDFGDVPD